MKNAIFDNKEIGNKSKKKRKHKNKKHKHHYNHNHNHNSIIWVMGEMDCENCMGKEDMDINHCKTKETGEMDCDICMENQQAAISSQIREYCSRCFWALLSDIPI